MILAAIIGLTQAAPSRATDAAQGAAGQAGNNMATASDPFKSLITAAASNTQASVSTNDSRISSPPSAPDTIHLFTCGRDILFDYLLFPRLDPVSNAMLEKSVVGSITSHAFASPLKKVYFALEDEAQGNATAPAAPNATQPEPEQPTPPKEPPREHDDNDEDDEMSGNSTSSE